MPKLTFPYSAIHISGISPVVTYRPMLSARLTAPYGAFLQCAALVDSGADACLFPLDVAHGLNLDLSLLPQSITGGVGSASNVTYHARLTLDIGGGLRTQALIGFTAGMNRAGFGLLGQQGFFENYNVEFRHRERLFTVDPA